MLELFDKNGNSKKIALEEDLNKKVDTYAKWINQLPTENNASYLFYASTDLTDVYGNTIPVYSRGIFINHMSSDGALIAIDATMNLYIGFRNGGNWHIRKI